MFRGPSLEEPHATSDFHKSRKLSPIYNTTDYIKYPRTNTAFKLIPGDAFKHASHQKKRRWVALQAPSVINVWALKCKV